MASDGKGGNGDQPSASTYLVIPYYSGDQGSRPLPSAEPFWMCNSIKINGTPYTGQQLPRKETVKLTLDAVNYGTMPAGATCLFFWANPTTNFTGASVTIIGQVPVLLARNTLTTTAPILWTVPDGTPQHICLLAKITAPGDLAPGDYDAAADRHFGQQNVHLTSLAPGGQIRVGFVMGNGRATTTRFRLEVTHVLVNHRALRHIVGANAVLRRAEEVNLMRTPSDAGQNLHSLYAELAVGELLEVELSARVSHDATPGSTIVLQLAQYQAQQHQPVGGLGVVVRVT
jgi:hypothetical protein